MSLYDYTKSKEIESIDPSFFACIMSAMRHADSWNLTKLREAFPDVWQELQERYNAPGGRLPGDPS